ncbi:MAG: NDP-sugar synthase [candidate division KSB1 bacterium]|nr:NDP-sugar synthase [candidate division KSB1 bacterium]
MFTAAILAAGEGSRLKAQGIATPKPLVAIGGVPMVERILRQLKMIGAGEIVCIINHESLEVLAHIQSREIGIPIFTLIKSTPSSFHSFCALLPFLPSEPVLVSLVDSIFDTAELEGFVRYARQQPRLDGLLAVTDFVADETPLRLRLGKKNRVMAIGREADASPYVTGGIYWFSERIFAAANQALARGVNRMRNFLAFLLDESYALEGYRFRKIIDVDTVEDIDLAERMGEQDEWNLTSRAFGEARNFRPTT